ncbi:MAG: Stage sporulation protein [Clostridia bacterium]|jgi:hypothetical protein|nr:Stage sporulation protein [Clostridia bacterium]
MNAFLESGYIKLNKYGEELCGDSVETVCTKGVMTLVLADGLGSGVKANILSTMTSKIIGTMMANDMSIEESVSTIAQTLPICSQRQIAYSTFTILQIKLNGDAYLIQYDNPSVIFLRDGKIENYEFQTRVICDKKIKESRFSVKSGDVFILMSDGVIHAGVGKTLNFGWQHENVCKYVEAHYNKEMSAKLIAATLSEACNDLYMEKPGDDATVAVMRVREAQLINLIIGPPLNKNDDDNVCKLFFKDKQAKKIVCGGTTSRIIENYLNEVVKIELKYEDPTLPPIGRMKGVDLVTEGVLTIGRVLDLSKNYLSNSTACVEWLNKEDAASIIAKILFEEATDINFFVGRALNPAHQNPDLPVTLSIKLNLIEELAKNLRIMGKNVFLYFF